MDTGRAWKNILSIGSQCLTSARLKAAGRKRFSGPFDWIFSDLGMVADCIEDDFAAFLDPAQLRPIPAAERPDPATRFAQHLLFKRRYGLDSIFNHYDPTTPEGYAYLARCVARFRAALLSGRPQLLLAVSDPDRGGVAAWERLLRLCARFPAVDVRVLIVRERAPVRAIEPRAAAAGGSLADLHVRSAMAGVAFADPADDALLADYLARLTSP